MPQSPPPVQSFAQLLCDRKMVCQILSTPFHTTYLQSLIFSNHSKIEGYRRYLSVDSLTLRRARLAHDRPLLDSLDGITSTKLKCCFKCFSTILSIILSWSWFDTSPTWNHINLKRTLLPYPCISPPSPIGQHCCHSHTFSSLHFGVRWSQVSHFLLGPTSIVKVESWCKDFVSL